MLAQRQLLNALIPNHSTGFKSQLLFGSQLPAKVQPEKWQVWTLILVFTPPNLNTWVEFWAPGFNHTLPQPLCAYEESISGWKVCLFAFQLNTFLKFPGLQLVWSAFSVNVYDRFCLQPERDAESSHFCNF